MEAFQRRLLLHMQQEERAGKGGGGGREGDEKEKEKGKGLPPGMQEELDEVRSAPSHKLLYICVCMYTNYVCICINTHID